MLQRAGVVGCLSGGSRQVFLGVLAERVCRNRHSRLCVARVFCVTQGKAATPCLWILVSKGVQISMQRCPDAVTVKRCRCKQPCAHGTRLHATLKTGSSALLPALSSHDCVCWQRRTLQALITLLVATGLVFWTHAQLSSVCLGTSFWVAMPSEPHCGDVGCLFGVGRLQQC